MVVEEPDPGWEFPGLDEESLEVVERLTEQKVSRTISALEIAMSAWDGAKEKAPELEDDIKKIKWFHSELCSWEKKSLMGIGHKDYDSRIKRLNGFYGICRRFQSR
jgi:hypothetical protein